MFGKNRKNTPGPDSGNLIYADTLPGEPAAKPVPGQKRRRTTGFLALGAAVILAAAAMMLWLQVRDQQSRYRRALELLDSKAYDAAMAEFEALDSFRDSHTLLTLLQQQQAAYDAACALVEQQRYDEAIAAFRALEDYADSAEQAAYGVTYQKALDLIIEIDVGKTHLLTRILTDQVRLTDENSYPTTVGYETAAALLESLGDYESARALIDRCYYSAGLVKLSWNDWDGALAYMEKMTEGTAAEFYQDYLLHYNEYANEEGP